jgi:hypothetical protein
MRLRRSDRGRLPDVRGFIDHTQLRLRLCEFDLPFKRYRSVLRRGRRGVLMAPSPLSMHRALPEEPQRSARGDLRNFRQYRWPTRGPFDDFAYTFVRVYGSASLIRLV